MHAAKVFSVSKCKNKWIRSTNNTEIDGNLPRPTMFVRANWRHLAKKNTNVNYRPMSERVNRRNNEPGNLKKRFFQCKSSLISVYQGRTYVESRSVRCHDMSAAFSKKYSRYIRHHKMSAPLFFKLSNIFHILS